MLFDQKTTQHHRRIFGTPVPLPEYRLIESQPVTEAFVFFRDIMQRWKAFAPRDPLLLSREKPLQSLFTASDSIRSAHRFQTTKSG